MYGRVNGQTGLDGRQKDKLGRISDRRKDVRKNDGQTDQWMDKRMDGQADGWTV